MLRQIVIVLDRLSTDGLVYASDGWIPSNYRTEANVWNEMPQDYLPNCIHHGGYQGERTL